MYEPWEAKLRIPEVEDPDAFWQDVWQHCFISSVKALMTGEGGVPLKFGLNVLKMIEMIGQSIQERGKVIENTTITSLRA